MRSNDINSIQAGIMRQLFFNDGLRFAEINVDDVPSDQFSYHLKQLLKYDLLEKSPDNTYRLSVMGRTRAIMLYPAKDSFIEQGFLAVRIVLSKVEDETQYFLLQERAAVPFKGTYGTPGDKILFGEDVEQAAIRAMQLQTGLLCDVTLCGIKHIKDNYRGKVVQDKYFFVFRASNPQGVLLARGRTGKNMWLSYDQVHSSGRSTNGGLELLEMAGTQRLQFDEQTFAIDSY